MKLLTCKEGRQYVVHDDTPPGLFKDLNSLEVCDFVQWADSLDDSKSIRPIWHPVVQNALYRKRTPKPQIDMLLKRGGESQ